MPIPSLFSSNTDTDSVSLRNLYQNCRSYMQLHGIEISFYELRLLLSEIMQVEERDLNCDSINLNSLQQQQLQTMLSKRAAHMPIDKILGHRGFYKYDFAVSSDVLSPRPDTEILLEAALALSDHITSGRALELGVGSGCLICSFLAEKTHMQGDGVDISDKALKIAFQNAISLKVADRLHLCQGDWFASDFVTNLHGDYDIIISNPPYIPTSEIASLEPDVKDYDPMLALDGGQDGLESYRRIAEITSELLKKGGFILLEVGEGQASSVADIFARQGLLLVNIIKDYADIKRCVILKK